MGGRGSGEAEAAGPREASGTRMCRLQALRAPCQADGMSVSEDRIPRLCEGGGRRKESTRFGGF